MIDQKTADALKKLAQDLEKRHRALQQELNKVAEKMQAANLLLADTLANSFGDDFLASLTHIEQSAVKEENPIKSIPLAFNKNFRQIEKVYFIIRQAGKPLSNRMIALTWSQLEPELTMLSDKQLSIVQVMTSKLSKMGLIKSKVEGQIHYYTIAEDSN